MATGKKPSGKRAAKAQVHASYLRVGCGQSARGYIAGEIHGVPGHRTHAHQPCLDQYTEGALSCPFCAAGIESQWRAYVPIWDVDWALRYVLIGEDISESVDAIERGEQVAITRGKNPISPLIVRHAPGLMRNLPDKAPWNAPVDMEQICLLLWQDDKLSQWVAKRGAPRRVSGSAVPLKSDGKPFGPMHKAAAQKYDAPPEPAAADASFEAITNRLKKTAAGLKPSRNGKHESDE